MSDLNIVTGGAGFIGSHLVWQLVEEGQQVRVLEKPGVDTAHLPSQVDVRAVDIRDRQAVFDAVRGGRRVFHLAANPNLWARDRTEFRAVNHLGAVNVLEACLEAGVERVLHTSTESILTSPRARHVIDENAEVLESDAVGPYCLSKLRAENAALDLARSGHPVLVANPTMPVGPGDRGVSPPTRLIIDLCSGHLPAFMECTLNLIDVRDVATGLRQVMERGRPGRRHLLAGENLTLSQLCRLLSGLTGVPAPRWQVPYPVGLAVAHASEFWSDRVTGRAPRASVTGVRLARRLMHFDPRRTLAEIGLSPRPAIESLTDAVRWLRESGRIS